MRMEEDKLHRKLPITLHSNLISDFPLLSKIFLIFTRNEEVASD